MEVSRWLKRKAVHGPRLKQQAFEAHLRRTYGLTPEQYGSLFASQGQKCRICSAPEPGGKGWHVDHCHKTDRVRGILCGRCNVMIAMAKERPEILEAAIKYLGAFQCH